MGYTHYFYQPLEDLNISNWEKMVLDFYKVLPEFYDILDHETGQKLEADMDNIFFNGIGEESHETFILSRKPDKTYISSEDTEVFNFCKTARKDYDIAVCCSLIIAKKHFPEIRVSSDGGKKEWLEACVLCQNILNYGFRFDIEKGDFY